MKEACLLSPYLCEGTMKCCVLAFYFWLWFKSNKDLSEFAKTADNEMRICILNSNLFLLLW